MASALVLKTWRVSNEPSGPDNTYIHINARKAGLIAWFLTLVGIDATTSIVVTNNKLEFRGSSLSGTDHRLIPLQNICSTYYGYHKPWKLALMIIAFFCWMAFGVGQAGGFLAGAFTALVGFGIAILLYFLNRTLTLGFVEVSGVMNGILFKRSVIENLDINQDEARRVCELIEALIELKQSV
jgi:hypothetical protein